MISNKNQDQVILFPLFLKLDFQKDTENGCFCLNKG